MRKSFLHGQASSTIELRQQETTVSALGGNQRFLRTWGPPRSSGDDACARPLEQPWELVLAAALARWRRPLEQPWELVHAAARVCRSRRASSPSRGSKSMPPCRTHRVLARASVPTWRPPRAHARASAHACRPPRAASPPPHAASPVSFGWLSTKGERKG